MFTLKASSPDNASKAILLPFHSRWELPMESELINAVFRRRGPHDWSPEVVYAYVGKPVSEIRMRLRVFGFRWISVDEAARMASKAGMSERAVRDYGESVTELCVFEIQKTDISDRPVSMKTLRDQFGYIPTPNYVRLSKHGALQLDKLLGLATASLPPNR